MSQNVQEVSIELGNSQLSIQTGKLAKQAGGAVLVRFGDSMVLASACANQEPREGIDFFPLTVDYREYTYSAGKIPGGFFKREGRPTEKEILTSRRIDRPIRPLFAKGFRCETQVVAMVLSADTDNDPDVLGLVGASAALHLSDIPFRMPIAAVRVGLVNGNFVVNPTYLERSQSLLNLLVATSEQGIVMVESDAQQVAEGTVMDALEFGHQQCKKIIAAIEDLQGKAGVPKREVVEPEVDRALYAQVEGSYRDRLKEALDTAKLQKQESVLQVKALKKELVGSYPPEESVKAAAAGKLFGDLREQIFREDLLQQRRRPDARAFDKVRTIQCEVGLLPRTHGSALFTRGETQALVTATLGTKEDAQRMDALEPGEHFKRFMLHYNFPPFSVGEVAFLRGPGRREIGHGALAERALLPVLPEEAVFPYTIRVVSDILESNGSSSMASASGATLALMDAGVPIKAPVAGIAMGLLMGDDGSYSILTDIAGAEDHYGDMDLKVAGTREGITALQMDIKVARVTTEIIREALEQARHARLYILDRMLETLPEPRTAISAYAPRIYVMHIPPDKIRDVIGPGGKVIRSIIERTGVKINVEDDGSVHIASSDEASAGRAMQIVADLTASAEMGKTYLGKVVRIVDFGAFVEIFPGTDGLLHISEIAEERVRAVADELREGDQILVKVINIDGNKVKLSRKAVLREQREKRKTAEATNS